MALLVLGDLQLAGFEIPAGLRFGGRQRVAVHKLLGGGRVIDAMGRDDAALTWQGIFSGAAASDRARTMDAIRASGKPVGMSWDVFSYLVVITSLEMDFQSPWWITYHISCTVLSDLSQAPGTNDPSLADAVLADVAAAAALVNVGGLLGAVSAPGALLAGSPDASTAIAQVQGVRSSVTAEMSGAEAGLDSSSVADILSASGTLAQLSNAQGFLERSLSNLQGIG